MLLRTLALPASLVLGAGLVGGCGAGEAIFGPETYTLHAPSTLDGYVTSAGAVLTNSTANGIAVGDNDADQGRRGFVRFNIAGLPLGAEIESAELRLAQAAVTGLPYVTLGTLRVDHVDIGAALDAVDYAAVALLANVGTLSTDATLTVKFLDVKAEILADIAAARTTSDFRLRFTTQDDGDGLFDTAHFEDMENNLATGAYPELVIVYK
jgi:hypothetical protein